MKVTVTAKALAPKFPCVMQNMAFPEVIVIFTGEGEGICVSPTEHPAYGRQTTDWAMHDIWEACCVTLDSTET